MLLGGAILEHATLELHPPVLGDIKVTSALPFDVGVYLVVIGLILMVFEAFGDDRDDENGDGRSADGARHLCARGVPSINAAHVVEHSARRCERAARRERDIMSVLLAFTAATLFSLGTWLLLQRGV